MSETRNRYVQLREALLLQITETLKHDERFVAAWLARINLCCTQQEQVATLRSLCNEMEALAPDVVNLGGTVPESPRSMIDMRLLLLS